MNPLSIVKKILFSLVPVAVLLLLVLVLELSLRVLPASKEFANVLFFNQFKLSRWVFLSERHQHLNVEWMLRQRRTNDDYMEQPEENRPAFDHVPNPYHVQTNDYGFRERQFPEPSEPSIVLIGDSVGFGKGVDQHQRFFSLLEERFPDVPLYNLALQGCTIECMTEVYSQYYDLLNPLIVVVQTSGNDIDQTLWREGVSHEVPDKPIPPTLVWRSKSYFLQWLQTILRDSTKDELNAHSLIAERYYEKGIHSFLQHTKAANSKVVSLNLPFAYGWNYGGHVSRLCLQYDHCTDVVVDLSDSLHPDITDGPADRFDFRTATELNLAIDTVHTVFPQPDYFLDVVHLSPQGHQMVADTLELPLRTVLDAIQLER